MESLGPGDDAVEELRAALRKPLPEIPCKYFYDDRGSALFTEITRLPEYYPTRTEEALLEAEADRIVAVARPRALAEIGSGTGRKIRLVLDAMRRAHGTRRCVLLDISPHVLEGSVKELSAEYPDTEFSGVVGDFERDLSRLGSGGGRMILFLAGTVGNLHPDAVPRFLRRLAAQMVPGDHFLVGLDLVKDPERLHAAYNDSAGVTAEFNRNILRVVNERFLGDFQPEAWDHVAFYDLQRQWIEMRLRARRPMRVVLAGIGVQLSFVEGDEIRTELSCKYTPATWLSRCRGTGLQLAEWFSDPERLFALALLRRTSDTLAP
jgi:L-histidine N-alpha-methyltransferase